MIGSLDSQVIEKFKEFQQKSGKYLDLDIKDVEFKKKNFNDIIDEFIKGSTPKYSSSSTNTIVIKSGQARGNYNVFDFKNTAYLDLTKVKNPKYLQNGDILINTTGVGTAGRVTLFDLSGNYVSDSHITALRYDLSSFYKFYLLYFFVNFGFKKLEKMAEGSGGQVELSMEKIKLLVIPIPKDNNENYKSIDIQKIIVEFLEYSFDNLERLKSNINKKYNLVTKMKKSLIPSTFKRTAIKNKFRKYAQENDIDFEITDITFNNENTFGSIFEFNGGSSKYTKPYYTNPKNKGDYPLLTGSTHIVEFIKPMNQHDINDAPAISYNKDNDKGSLAFYHTEPFIVGGHHYALKLKNEFLKNIDLKYSYYSLSEHFFKNMYYQSKETRANSGVIKNVKFLIPEPLQAFSSIKIQQILANFIENVENELETKFLNPINKCLEVIEKYKETYLKRTFNKIVWSKK